MDATRSMQILALCSWLVFVMGTTTVLGDDGAPAAGQAPGGFAQMQFAREPPYWGESDHSYNDQYHWTDGQGNYRHSNDSTYNPNVGAGGGPTWQRMEPAGR